MIEVHSERASDGARGLRRVVAVGLAAAVAAGAGGFLAGRATDGDASTALGAPDSVAVDAPGAASSTVGEGGSAETDVATSAPDTAAPMTTAYVLETEATAVATVPPYPKGAGSDTTFAYPSVYDERMGAPDAGGPDGEDAPWTLLLERTTADGILLRAHMQEYPADVRAGWPGVEGWTPAGWCMPRGHVRVGITDASTIGVSDGPWYAEPFGGVSATLIASGFVEGSPITGFLLQVADDVDSVSLTASGTTDSVAPRNGVAVVAVHSSRDEFDALTIILHRSDGSSETLRPMDLMERHADPAFRAGCEPPPPALPPPGEQPADPAAAEAEFRASWEIVRDFSSERTDRLEYVDDPTGIAAAWDQLLAGQYAENAQTAVSTIRELTFTSPTEVWFRYDIATDLVPFPNRYGIARRGDDGVWRITRDTLCQDIALAPGAACDPPAERVLPPSAADDPRFQPPPDMPPGYPTVTTVVLD